MYKIFELSVMIFCKNFAIWVFTFVSFLQLFSLYILLQTQEKMNKNEQPISAAERVGPITQRSVDRNNYSLSNFFTHL